MPTVPVAIDLSASDTAVARLERHSYVNLINVVHAELQLVERMIERPGSLRSAIHLAEAASRAYKEKRVARRHLHELAQFADLVEGDLGEALEEAGTAADEEDVTEAVKILRDVLPDAHLRVQEVIARHELLRPVRLRLQDELRERLHALLQPLESPAAAVSAAPAGASQPVDAAVPVVHLETDSGAAGDGETRREVRVPLGLERALRTLVRDQGEYATITRVDLQQESTPQPESTLHVEVSGSSAPEYLTPLLSGLRPSELHTLLDTRGEPLRSLAMLAYFTTPGGTARLLITEGEAQVEFRFSADLAANHELTETD